MSRLKLPFNSILSRKTLVPIVVLFVIIVSGLLIYFATNSGLNLGFGGSNTDDPNVEAENIVEEVDRIYLLPDEVPTLATVSDKNQLADQVFFKNAENGDKVLIYSTASVAILYRPSLGKIINVGPISVDSEQIEANSGEDAQPEEPVEEKALSNVDVLILNGTTTVGLTQLAADQLGDIEFVSISDRDDAVNKPYPDTVVVYIDSANKPQTDAIAKIFSSSVAGKLPEGESANGADIVIILGEDYASN